MNFTILSNWSEHLICFYLVTSADVLCSQQTVGVIFKTERISFRVLDQNGIVRNVQPHQITMRKESNRAIATDSQGYPLRVSDNMKELDGEVCPLFWCLFHKRVDD